MSTEKLNLSTEFEKICIDPLRKDSCESSSCSNKIQASSSDAIASQITHQNFKVSRRKPLIKPSRLKFIYQTQKDELKEGNVVAAAVERKSDDDAEDYSTEAFQLLRDLRISPSEMNESPTTSQPSASDKNSLKKSCSAQYSNQLQQQLSSSSEFDSTIDVMSDYFSYHLNLHKDKSFSNVMYL